MRVSPVLALALGTLAAVAAALGCGSPHTTSSYAGALPGGGGEPYGNKTASPTVVAPQPDVSPAVAQALRRQDGRLRPCWDRLAVDRPELADGRAIVQFRLDPSGRVLSAELLSGPVEDPSFRTCVEERARGMSFPQGDASSVFSHSFTFGLSAGGGVE